MVTGNQMTEPCLFYGRVTQPRTAQRGTRSGGFSGNYGEDGRFGSQQDQHA